MGQESVDTIDSAEISPWEPGSQESSRVLMEEAPRDQKIGSSAQGSRSPVNNNVSNSKKIVPSPNPIETLASSAQRAGLFPASGNSLVAKGAIISSSGISTSGASSSGVPNSAKSPAALVKAIAVEADLAIPTRSLATISRQEAHIPMGSGSDRNALATTRELAAPDGFSDGLTDLSVESREEKAHSTSAQELWRRIGSKIALELDPQIFEAYLAPLNALRFNPTEAQLVVACSSRFISSQVSNTHGKRLNQLLVQELAAAGTQIPSVSSAEVSFEVVAGEAGRIEASRNAKEYVSVLKAPLALRRSEAAVVPAANHNAADHNAATRQRALAPQKSDSQHLLKLSKEAISKEALEKTGLHSRYTFASFVVGSSNQFCHAAALRVSEAPGQSYNPLFIYGGVGLGKTHLLHAIGHAVLARNPTAQILYLSSEAFTNELIMALRHARMDEFKTRMRSIDVLLIDDIQFMIGKERTQEEFFHTFNALYNAKKQIVITSDKIPQEFPGMEERLITRFSWGLTADLQAPDFETRVAIIKRKAAQESFTIPEDVAHFVAEHVSSNVRELEGALTRLHALSSIQNVPISNELAQVALRHLLQPKAVRISIDDIKKAVAQHFGIKPADIISKRRTKNLSFPRHIAMYLCRKHTTASYPEIGTQFGGRDHSSVIHAATVVSLKISTDKELKEILKEIEQRLLGGT